MTQAMYYSPSKGSFYTPELQAVYEASGSWPGDLVSLTQEEYDTVMSAQGEGKYISPGEDGYPSIADSKPISQEEAIQAASRKQAALLSSAMSAISLWQTELQLGTITDDEKAQLVAWLAYIKLLKAVDTSTAPDITWPTAPAAA
ncbi:tail fiber assembly protein [Chimaeribacter californicus]|nr:tail fiber assembly protein [Chimaeribacter californicus]